jgi:hypothetical protein
LNFHEFDSDFGDSSAVKHPALLAVIK